MRRLLLMGALATALSIGVAAAQDVPQQQGATDQAGQAQKAKPAKPGKVSGRTAQIAGESAAGGTRLGMVRLPKAVTANGEPLRAGTYQIRVTDEEAKPATGETAGSERWVEFLQNGTVKGKELASVIPDSEIAQVAEGPGKPRKGGTRVDLLKSEKYWRIWVNRNGNNYLIHLPAA